MLICSEPGITGDEINARLQLGGKDIYDLISPYIKRGEVIAKTLSVRWRCKHLRSFTATEKYSQNHASQEATGKRFREYKNWTDKDKQLLADLYPTHNIHYLAKRLGRTKKQVESKARALHLLKDAGYVPPYKTGPTGERVEIWSPEEVQILTTRYSNETIAELQKIIKKTENQIQNKACKLGIRKSSDFWTRSAKSHLMSGNLKRFVALPIGTTTVWGGYVFVKIDGPQPWQLKHQIEWIAQHGTYNTRTHALWFIDRNPMNCEISNLELITHQEKRKRTLVPQYPEELRDVIRLYNKLKRKLNEKH